MPASSNQIVVPYTCETDGSLWFIKEAPERSRDGLMLWMACTKRDGRWIRFARYFNTQSDARAQVEISAAGGLLGFVVHGSAEDLDPVSRVPGPASRSPREWRLLEELCRLRSEVFALQGECCRLRMQLADMFPDPGQDEFPPDWDEGSDCIPDDGEHDCERSAFPDGVSVPAVPVL
jgi:hypothetical protein